MKRLAFLIVSIFLTTLTYGQLKNKDNKIVYRDVNILLDGKLDEAVWSDLKVEDKFVNYFPNNGDLATNKTKVKMFHNGKNLFISAVYNDSIPDVQIGSLKRDDIRVSGAESDSFAIVIDTYNQKQSGYFFIVNMGGALIDALISRQSDAFGLSTSWNSIWNAKTSVNGTQKIYEVEIPLKILSYKEDASEWGIMFHTRNIKANEWTTSTPIDRNFSQFDLRFSKVFEVENLSENKTTKFAVTPSLTINHTQDIVDDVNDTMIKPSLDLQYNVSSSLKLDATINPDFSQIDVDRQVTNLSRFSIFFPERRNFFLENSDLFNGLGVRGVNPFYSRRIGAESEISFGLKLSGNIAKKTRLGVLNVATKEEGDTPSQNYGALVIQQQLSDQFTATGFIVNRQETDGFSFLDDYNRVSGVNLNFQSKNNRWSGLANFASSATNNVSGDNNFYNVGLWYNKINMSGYAGIRRVGKNYITDVGFVPRLYNYDAISETVVREGYLQSSGRFRLTKFYKNSDVIDNHRYLNVYNENYWDDDGKLIQSVLGINNDLVFKNQSAIFGGFRYEYLDLKYAFDPLNNGNAIVPGKYRYLEGGLGYESPQNKKLQFGLNSSYGKYYSGSRHRIGGYSQYRLMPLARLQFRYEQNKIDLNELGKDTFHLARFTSEIFFSNRLNWTTYVQYNTQFDNFNVNSRLQWEYKPLSYIYLVLSDNFDQYITRKNWGIAFKMNYRFDF